MTLLNESASGNRLKAGDPEVLVIDDAPENRWQLSEMLTQNGCRVRESKSGEEGLNSAAESPPDLILLDIRMPGMDGFEVCKHLKASPQLREIPVIFISALDEIPEKVRGFHAGGVDYIVKPYQMEEVLARVKTHLELRRLQLDIRRAYNKIEAALEKELLLNREIHHRVKNNLQVISSLLYLQSASITDPNTLEILREGQSRIHSIALIHEKLYASTDLTKIESAGYTRQLTADLLHAYNVKQGAIRTDLDCGEGVFFGLDEAIPFGLIVTELVSNALKHAFPSGRQGRIALSLQPIATGLLELTVRDDGKGFPEGFAVEKATTFGLQLVRDLTRQLNGTIKFQSDHGTAITITFANPESAPK